MDKKKNFGLKGQSIYYKYLISYSLSSIIPLLIVVYFAYQYIFPFVEFEKTLVINSDLIRLIILLTLFSSLLGFYITLDIIRAVSILSEKAKLFDDVKSKAGGSRIKIHRNDEIGDLSKRMDFLSETVKEQLERLDYLVDEIENSRRTLAESTKKLSELNIYDDPTNVYNRRYISCRLEEEILRTKKFSNSFGFMLIECKVKDGLPQEIEGDVLVKIAGLINNSIRDVDILGRFDDAQFVVIMPELKIDEANEISGNISITFNKLIDEFSFISNINIGIAFVPKDSGDSTNIVIKATLALQKAKKEKTSFAFYSD